MKKIPILLLPFLFSNLITLGQTTPKTEKGWSTFSDKNYSVQYPDTWILDRNPQMGMSFVVLSKLSDPKDQFKENVNLLIQDLKGKNMTLKSYTELSEEQIATMVTNGKLIESKTRNENGSEFQKLIYTGDQGMYKLKFEQYYWVKNEKAYVLTLTCETSQFEKFKATGEKIMNSFKFK